jgi:uncharacterized protein (DUF2252 family)
VTRSTREERRDVGRDARSVSPRSSHHGFRPAAERPDPLETLAAQDATRVPGLVPMRYSRMSASPFAFFRGQAAVMAGDLAASPTTGIETQLCGNAHVGNLGTVATPDGRLLFDLDDVHETLPGPFEWDLKRLATSIVIAARHRDRRVSVADAAVHAAVGIYRDVMGTLADADVMAAWHTSVDREGLLRGVDGEVARGVTPPRVALATRALFGPADPSASAFAAGRLTEVTDGGVRFREDPPLLSRSVLPIGARDLAASFLETYRDRLPEARRALLARYEVADVARRVSGLGSVGTRAFVLLLHGRDADDLVVLEAKEAGPSALETPLPPSEHRPAGSRVVEGRRLLQSADDVFLGWLRTVGPDGVERELTVRQLRGTTLGIDPDVLSPDGLVAQSRLCARLLANAHARGGDAAVIAGYVGTNQRFAESLCAFAHDYADVNERDHARLVDAIAAGRVVAETGR